MENDYNDILKEKKVYEESVLKNKHPMLKRFFLLGIFLSIIIIGISYIIYYKTILANESIFLNNMTKIINNYSILYKNIGFNYDLSNNYTLDGNVTAGGNTYRYSFIKDGAKLKRTFSNQNNSSSYYYDGDLSYVKSSKLGNSYIEKEYILYSLEDYSNKYLKITNNFYDYLYNTLLNNNIEEIYQGFYNIDNYNYVLNNIKNNYNNIVNNNYIRKFYFENKRPIVEVDLVLDSNDINNILGNGSNNLEVKDDLEVSIIMKNGAIMNDIKNIKIVINNKTTKERRVINYKNNIIEYSDNNGNKSKITLTVNNNNNFSLKYYSNDVLYSVLSGGSDNGKYIYNYQVIDKVYNLKISIKNINNNYSFLLESNIDNNIDNILIDGTFVNEGSIEEDVNDVIKYNNLTDIQTNILNSGIKQMLFS